MHLDIYHQLLSQLNYTSAGIARKSKEGAKKGGFMLITSDGLALLFGSEVLGKRQAGEERQRDESHVLSGFNLKWHALKTFIAAAALTAAMK